MTIATSPRKPLFALLMSLVLPGFGQLYNGEVNKAIWLFLGFAFFFGGPVDSMIALHLHGAAMMLGLVIGLLLTIAIWLFGMADGWRSAARRQGYQPQRWQISGMYVLVFILCNVLVMPIVIVGVRSHLVESFRIPSSSMIPTLLPGDFIFADKRYNCPVCKYPIRRGDIVIFTNPNDRTMYFVKRIIGLPGDRVQISSHAVSINGKSLVSNEVATPHGAQVVEGDGARQWQVLWKSTDTPLPEPDVTVPAGQAFVLGDNRNGSVDSRSFGTIPMQDVVGKVRQIWFSYGDSGVRWNRLGDVAEPASIPR